MDGAPVINQPIRPVQPMYLKNAAPPPKKNKSQLFQSSQDILLNLEAFKAQSQDLQRKILGEQLFPKISQVISSSHPESSQLVPKITGMLIDLEVFEVEEIIAYFNDSKQLRERIAEAQELLEETNRNE